MYKSISNIKYTVNSGLCAGCGICEGICYRKAIRIQVSEDNFRPVIDTYKCNNCGLCLNACPGVGVNLLELAQRFFPDARASDKLAGRYNQCYIGHSNDNELRTQAASGGVLSQFLIWLLENDKIDGALITKFDKDAPLKERSFIARNKEDVLSATGSKYAPVSLHDGLKELRDAKAGRYVIVGLPCHIQGIRKQMSFDKHLRNKVIGLFSLFCSGNQTFKYTEYILKQCGGNVKDLHYLAYRTGCPTGMVAKGSTFDFFKAYKAYNMPLKSTFYPKRCLLCVDMLGELSDIAFGDIHIEDTKIVGTGISALIVRSLYWQKMLQESVRVGSISLSEISIHYMLYKRSMASVKKGRNASFVELLKKMHMSAPNYDSKYNAHVDIKILLRYVAMRTKQFIGNHKCLWFLLPNIN